MKIRYLHMNAYGMGGIVRTVVNQANAMARRGHDVELVSVSRPRDEPQFAVDPRVRMVALQDERAGIRPDTMGMRVRRRAFGGVVPPEEPRARRFTGRAEHAIRGYLESLSGGVLVTTRFGLNVMAARLAPREVVRVAQEHTNLSHHRGPRGGHILQHYGGFDAIVTLTWRDRADYQRAFPKSRVVCIPNAVHRLDGAPCDPGAKIVITAGRLARSKGYDLLLRAFNQVVRAHPGWRLHIYGAGETRAGLEKWIVRLALKEFVELKGVTHDLDSRMAEASVFALSSRHEGLPMVLLEAMTHRLPVVSFDCPTGPADILTHEVDGLLLPPKDVAAMARALNRLIENPGLREHLGQMAAKTVRDYGPEAIAPMWEDLFADLTSRKAHGR